MAYQLEITTRCNFDCFYCAGRAMPQKDMTWETFTKIIDSIKTPQTRVTLQGEGEPSWHPEFRGMAQYLTHKGHVSHTVLNGSVLFLETLREFFPTFAITVDTVNPEEAALIGRHNLPKVLANVQALVDHGLSRRLTIITIDSGQKLSGVKAWVASMGAQHLIMPLIRKYDYSKRYAIQPAPLQRRPSRCAYVDFGALKFFRFDGMELPCCYMKDSSEFTTLEAHRSKLTTGRAPATCVGCQFLIPL